GRPARRGRAAAPRGRDSRPTRTAPRGAAAPPPRRPRGRPSAAARSRAEARRTPRARARPRTRSSRPLAQREVVERARLDPARDVAHQRLVPGARAVHGGGRVELAPEEALHQRAPPRAQRLEIDEAQERLVRRREARAAAV